MLEGKLVMPISADAIARLVECFNTLPCDSSHDGVVNFLAFYLVLKRSLEAVADTIDQSSQLQAFRKLLKEKTFGFLYNVDNNKITFSSGDQQLLTAAHDFLIGQGIKVTDICSNNTQHFKVGFFNKQQPLLAALSRFDLLSLGDQFKDQENLEQLAKNLAAAIQSSNNPQILH